MLHRMSLLFVGSLPFLFLVITAGGAAAQGSKTLRRGDTVIVQTELLSDLPTRHTAHLRLFSARDGRLSPIDHRFYARDGDGESTEREKGNGFFLDDDDELVFSAKDAGDKVGAGAFPLDCDAAMELIISDPITGETGWAYVLHFPGRPAALPWDRSRQNDRI